MLPCLRPQAIHSQAQVAGLPIERFHRLVLCLKWALLVSLHLGEATITVDCFHSLKLPLVNMLLATPSPFPHPKALPVSLPVSCVPVSNMPLPPRAALELSLGPLLVCLAGNEQLLQWFCPVSRYHKSVAPGSPSPYDSLYCKCALSPQGVERESTTVQSTRKQFTSRYGTQSGSSTPFSLQGSIAYERSPQLQGTASSTWPCVSIISKCIIPIARCFQSVYCSVFSEAACLYLHGQLWHPGWVLSSLHPAGKYHLWWITSTSRCRKSASPWVFPICKCVVVLTPWCC